MSVIDTGVLWHHIPGGMFTNMVSQLKEAEALDRLAEVYTELPRTREELGYPPLVTPTSQIVGTQAISNVLFGRYKVISQQVKDYVYGLYGKPPASINPKIQKIVLEDYARGETPITCRPADILEPELAKAKEATKDIARDIGDVLTYALYPTSGMTFLRWKYGLEEAPAETKARTMKDVRREDQLIAKAKAGELVDKAEVKTSPQGASGTTLNALIDGKYHKVDIGLSSGSSSTMPASIAEPQVEAEEEKDGEVNGSPLAAPMPGIIIRYLGKEGDKVITGDGVAILEAMKMENILPAHDDGKVMSINFKPGDKVNTNDVLAIIV